MVGFLFAARWQESHLGAEHGGQLVLAGGEREPHHPVEAVVIGDRERGQLQPGRFGHQFLGMTGPVEKGEVGVAMELGVAHAGTVPNICSYPPPEADDTLKRGTRERGAGRRERGRLLLRHHCVAA